MPTTVVLLIRGEREEADNSSVVSKSDKSKKIKRSINHYSMYTRVRRMFRQACTATFLRKRVNRGSPADSIGMLGGNGHDPVLHIARAAGGADEVVGHDGHDQRLA